MASLTTPATGNFTAASAAGHRRASEAEPVSEFAVEIVIFNEFTTPAPGSRKLAFSETDSVAPAAGADNNTFFGPSIEKSTPLRRSASIWVRTSGRLQSGGFFSVYHTRQFGLRAFAPANAAVNSCFNVSFVTRTSAAAGMGSITQWSLAACPAI